MREHGPQRQWDCHLRVAVRQPADVEGRHHASPRVNFRGERPGLLPEVGALSHQSSARFVRRFVGLVAATVTLGSTLALVGATQASAASADYQFLSDVNSSRAQHGLKALVMVSDLHSLATNWSQHMASGGCGGGQSICHNPNLTSQGGNWQEIGENVGVGPSESSIETAFMNSPEHRANILNGDYTEVGIGTATGSDGRLYVTQDFRKPMGGSSSSGSTHHSSGSTTHHSSTTTHHSSTTTQHSSGTTQPSSSRPAVRRAAPRPAPSLAARLRTAAHHAGTSNDPVRQAFTFVTTMAELTG